MNATIALDNFNRLAVSRALRATAGFKRKQPLRAVAMPGKIIIEAMPASRQAGQKQGPRSLDRRTARWRELRQRRQRAAR